MRHVFYLDLWTDLLHQIYEFLESSCSLLVVNEKMFDE